MKTEAWLAWRLLFSRRSLFGGSAPLSLFGLVLGVASLVAAMAVVSGFEVSLRDSMSDVSGHVMVVRRSRATESVAQLEQKIRESDPSLVAATAFLRVEALFAHQGQIQGVILQGVEQATRDRVLDFRSRLMEGSIETPDQEGVPAILVGTGLARRFDLKVGSRAKIVVPVADPIDPGKFSRRLGEFRVAGILDLGKYDWNERLVLANLKPLQDLAGVGDKYHGLMLRFPDAEAGRAASFHLSQTMGATYSITDWHELNENLFEAVRLERVVIFFVIYIIVIVAAFNIASTLFVNVIRRTDEIALLKSLGLSRRAVVRVFSAQGIFFGAVGYVLGLALGLILCLGFTYLQGRYHLMSGAVYKVEGIEAHLRWIDLVAIALATLGICFLAALAPALRGSRLTPVEGLRNE